MLIVQYKPNDSSAAIADGKIKEVAADWVRDITYSERKVVVISQTLMIDGIRAALVDLNVDPSLIAIEVYNEEDELMESVSITDRYCLTSWSSFPQVHVDCLRTVVKSGKYI
ncbi:hypothetical protein GAP32_359 [Cronobacter phage vB_CsaM_GAP32]|uniref:Uncharacterized protein n=1 Tax=Cronobacter phage vB_CsaM_GAP32 TaxID=1141136 RepID=K4FB66_9CAUD|nr:hypothetical protein GAP32_359 [Cronobacter phage vB_CsaM_GAP32]AFC21809.1 hypothetical protein GAP32_359 [Cronobacter phage vB_CsaM_GAP32]